MGVGRSLTLRPTFRRLTWPGRRVDGLRRLELVASHTYKSFLELLGEIHDLDAANMVMLAYVLDDSEALLGALNPSWLLAARARGAASQTRVLRRLLPEVGGRVALCDRPAGWDTALAEFMDAADDDADMDDWGVQSEVESEEEDFVESQASSEVALSEPASGDEGSDAEQPVEEEGAGDRSALSDVDMGEASASGSSSSASSSSSSSSSSESAADGGGGGPAAAPAVAAEIAPANVGPQRRPGRGDAAAEVPVNHGFLRFYDKPGRKFVVAHCEAHPGCRLTRTCIGSDRQGREGQGRPLGLLLAWLGKAPLYAGAQSHVHMDFLPTLEERRFARDAAGELPGMAALFDTAERPCRAGEEEEPAVVP